MVLYWLNVDQLSSMLLILLQFVKARGCAQKSQSIEVLFGVNFRASDFQLAWFLSTNMHETADRKAPKVICRCVLYPVDQQDYLHFVALKLAFLWRALKTKTPLRLQFDWHFTRQILTLSQSYLKGTSVQNWYWLLKKSQQAKGGAVKPKSAKIPLSSLDSLP